MNPDPDPLPDYDFEEFSDLDSSGYRVVDDLAQAKSADIAERELPDYVPPPDLVAATAPDSVSNSVPNSKAGSGTERN